MTGAVTDYTHIAGNRDYVLDVLRLKIPRALCGVSLAGYPGEAGGDLCPQCAALDSGKYPCCDCGGTGVSRLTRGTCGRCEGSGMDPYALRGAER